jgi:hypothetical protein
MVRNLVATSGESRLTTTASPPTRGSEEADGAEATLTQQFEAVIDHVTDSKHSLGLCELPERQDECDLTIFRKRLFALERSQAAPHDAELADERDLADKIDDGYFLLRGKAGDGDSGAKAAPSGGGKKENLTERKVDEAKPEVSASPSSRPESSRNAELAKRLRKATGRLYAGMADAKMPIPVAPLADIDEVAAALESRSAKAPPAEQADK